MKKLYDFLFVLTEQSENDGEEILVEASTLSEADAILEKNGFSDEEYRYITKMSTAEGERLGLDTY